MHTTDNPAIAQAYDQIREQNTLVQLWGGAVFPPTIGQGGDELHTFMVTVREQLINGVFSYQVASVLGYRGGVGGRGREEKVCCRAVKYVELP